MDSRLLRFPACLSLITIGAGCYIHHAAEHLYRFYPLPIGLSTLGFLCLYVLRFRATPIHGRVLFSLSLLISGVIALGFVDYRFYPEARLMIGVQHEPLFFNHPVRGFSMKPNAIRKYYSATYHIASDGCRDSSNHVVVGADPNKSILFLGCSFTFGHLMNDDETYPAVLGKKLGSHIRIHNKATNGWGVVQNYYVLKDFLSKNKLPALVSYGWIHDHFRRAYRREDWLKNFWFYDNVHAAVDFVGGKIVELPPIQRTSCLPDSFETRRREQDIVYALIEKMDTICSSHGARFRVVILPTADASASYYTDELFIMALKSRGIRYIDLRSIACTFFRDGHPSHEGYRQIAEALSSESVFRDVGQEGHQKASSEK